MSSILKALKRLEEDKAERSDVPVDIGRDILRQPRRQRRSTALPALSLAVAGGLVVVGLLLMLNLWKSVKTPGFTTKIEPAVGAPPATPQQSAVAPSDRLSDYREPEVVEVRMAAPPAAIANKPPVTSTSRPAEHPTEAAAPAKTPDLAPPAKPAAPAVVQQEARPHLVVSGIVYQPDRQARLAVVNDLPVMEGTVIEGARVEEILADRVRFAWEGGTFEVELGELE
jgi:general secretion pathway protein B